MLKTLHLALNLVAGRVHTEETKAKMSKSAMGRIHSEATRKANRISQPNRTEIRVADISNEKVMVFLSIREAAKELQVSVSSIWRNLNKTTLVQNKYLIESVKK